LKPVVEVMLAMGWCKIYTTTALRYIGFWPCAGSGSAGCDPALISCSGWGWPKSAVVRIFAGGARMDRLAPGLADRRGWPDIAGWI